MKARSFIGLSLASILLSVLSTFATAGMIVQTVDKTPDDFFGQTEFQPFDTTQGSLTQVLLDVELSARAFISNPFNFSFPNFCVTFNACVGTETLEVVGVQSLLPLSLSNAVSVTDSDVDAGTFVNLSISTVDYDFPNLMDFIQPGLKPILSVSRGNDGFFSSDYVNEQGTIAQGTITLKYNFTQAPVASPIGEPTTLALLGLGLAGMGLLGRYRSA